MMWNPFFLKDITAIEKVQRRFTKRLRGMSGLTYYQRLIKLGLESLELRRIGADRLIFGLRGRCSTMEQTAGTGGISR